MAHLSNVLSITPFTAQQYTEREENAVQRIHPAFLQTVIQDIQPTLQRCGSLDCHLSQKDKGRIQRLGLAMSADLPDTHIIGRIDRSFWSLVAGGTKVRRNEEVRAWEVTPPASKILILSSNLTPTKLTDPHPYQDQDQDLITIFRDEILGSAAYPQLDLYQMRWASDIRYYSKEELDKAIFLLRKKGFSVEISEPYFILEKTSEINEIKGRQDLIVKIPEKGAAASSASQSSAYPYEPELTVDKVLLAREEALHTNPVRVLSSSDSSLKDILVNLRSDLQTIADRTPLTRRWGVDVPRLEEKALEKLLDEIHAWGYSVKAEPGYRLSSTSLEAKLVQRLWISLPYLFSLVNDQLVNDQTSYSYKTTTLAFEQVLENFLQVGKNIDAPCAEFVAFAEAAFDDIKNMEEKIKELEGFDEGRFLRAISGLRTNCELQRQEIVCRLSLLLGKEQAEVVSEYEQLAEKYANWEPSL